MSSRPWSGGSPSHLASVRNAGRRRGGHVDLAAAVPVERLEPRTLCAAFTWDGKRDGSGVTPDDNWSNRFNWVGDVAPPVPPAGDSGSDLFFPPGAARFTAHNDRGSVTTPYRVNSLHFSSGGYELTGNV